MSPEQMLALLNLLADLRLQLGGLAEENASLKAAAQEAKVDSGGP